ncbi:MAG: pirin family protein, partial [Candidatus Lokiarchaeota archaeon]|nr:pirin family protein [Candidatus Lokiarchaeota archaeon]
PNDYLAGFPWHPHRGIETITYMIHGQIEHGDSMDNTGVIGAGDVQWMTAGSGIIHQEMPKKNINDPLLAGFQLWANLPASHKMMDPRYRDIKKEQIPEVVLADGVKVKIICGEIDGVKGPVQDVITDPEYLDVYMDPNTEFKHLIDTTHNVFAYIIEGEAIFEPSKDKFVSAENLVIYREGDELVVKTKEKPVRFLLISGKPIGEPVAWRGPIVMNTEEELRVAFREYSQGTFIKH